MDEILCEVETDKVSANRGLARHRGNSLWLVRESQVTVEIRAPDAGVIQELCAKEGDTVLVRRF